MTMIEYLVSRRCIQKMPPPLSISVRAKWSIWQLAWAESLTCQQRLGVNSIGGTTGMGVSNGNTERA